MKIFKILSVMLLMLIPMLMESCHKRSGGENAASNAGVMQKSELMDEKKIEMLRNNGFSGEKLQIMENANAANKKNAIVTHIFDSLQKKDLLLETQSSPEGDVVAKWSQNPLTQTHCTPGVFDENGKYYTVAFKNLVGRNGEPEPTNIAVNIVQNLTGSGQWPGTIVFSKARVLPWNGYTSVDLQFCSVQTDGTFHSFVRQFSVDLFTSDVLGKLTVGYQGWFRAAGDGSPRNSWVHWSRGTQPSPGNQTFELWPDVREYTNTHATAYANLANGQPAKLFSSYSESTIQLHMKWIRDYGIDTVALQRFGSEFNDPAAKSENDKMAELVRNAAENFERKFYIQYDISGWNDFAEKIKTDWTSTIISSLKLTSSPAYAKHQGKPIVCIWGIGFSDHPGDATQSLAVINWFKSQGVYVIGGVPTYWRNSINDSKAAFQDVYKAYDMVQPWLVGRITNLASSDQMVANVVKYDLAYAKKIGVDYVPVIFPGFAWSNWNGGAPNMIPRMHGDFMWRQAFNLKTADALHGVYVAMFDEYDEATAIAKAAEDKSMIPTDQPFLTLDADGQRVSSDFYLRLTGDIGRMMKDTIPVSTTHPTTHEVQGQDVTTSPVKTAPLYRYYNRASREHIITTDPNLPVGFVNEGVLGNVLLSPEAATHAIYGCKAEGDQFLSIDAKCEGQLFLRSEGFLFDNPAPGRAPLFRCFIDRPKFKDHFVSLRKHCEAPGIKREGLMGYLKQ